MEPKFIVIIQLIKLYNLLQTGSTWILHMPKESTFLFIKLNSMESNCKNSKVHYESMTNIHFKLTTPVLWRLTKKCAKSVQKWVGTSLLEGRV